jgi:hypothetical protein
MLSKGDIILITDSKHSYAGYTGTVRKVMSKNNKVIIKLSKDKQALWIEKDKLIKITKKQQEEFKVLLKEKS